MLLQKAILFIAKVCWVKMQNQVGERPQGNN